MISRRGEECKYDYRHLQTAPLETVVGYMQQILASSSGNPNSANRGGSKSPPPSSSKLGLKVVLATPLGKFAHTFLRDGIDQTFFLCESGLKARLTL